MLNAICGRLMRDVQGRLLVYFNSEEIGRKQPEVYLMLSKMTHCAPGYMQGLAMCRTGELWGILPHRLGSTPTPFTPNGTFTVNGAGGVRDLSLRPMG